MQITFRSHVCWDEEYESSIVVYHEFKMNNNTLAPRHEIQNDAS